MFSETLKPKFDNSTETECPRISTGDRQSRYQSEDSTKSVEISTQLTKKNRYRHEFRLNQAKVTADPYDTSQNIDVSCSAFIVLDRPVSGYTAEEVRKLAEGLKAILTEANLKKLLASES
jgi:hypothetical protein